LRPLRLVPDGTAIKFMRGRFAGVIVSAILSIISVVLFFYPGLNLGVDFRGGIVVELRGPHPLPADTIREAFAPLGFGDLRVQEFGSPRDALIRFENKSQLQDAQRVIAARVAEALPDVQMRRIDTHAKLPFEAEPDVQKHSDKCECGRHQAVAKQLPAHPGAHDLVATLILDITKTIGFFGITQIEFDLLPFLIALVFRPIHKLSQIGCRGCWSARQLAPRAEPATTPGAAFSVLARLIRLTKGQLSR